MAKEKQKKDKKKYKSPSIKKQKKINILGMGC